MLIAIDAGHGMATAGKRTPIFTDGTKSKETGQPFMHENEFNRAVRNYLVIELRRCGFGAILTSDYSGQIDTPLIERMALANKSKADMFISIHANAFKGIWGNHGGIDTFCYTDNKNRKLAEIVQEKLVDATKLRDRGVKSADFYVLRNAKMPAILCECGFMDSLTDAKFLLDDEYRKKVAKAMAQGVCEYSGIKYIEGVEEVEEIKKDEVASWAKVSWDKAVAKGILDGTRPTEPMTRQELACVLDRLGFLK